ncbi:MAG: hypothetical protein LBH70_01265 [Spirochaetaceae bacterium]|jgi:hypothetical protein|nr:hypothetical protein [Spirochaetaceae bacterium]
MKQVRDREAYQKVTDAFRRRRNGATIADIIAKTALPLRTVQELVPIAADEYSARLEVTESGEILYSFPRGFVSKYRGFRAGLRRVAEKIQKGIKIAASWVFKVWIMLMLVGYFVFFMLIALAALMLSMAASSNSDNRSSRRGGEGIGGLYLASRVFNLIIHIWFYSELFKPANSYSRGWNSASPARPKSRPLHKAIFSFVFGDGDPNADWPAREKQAVIAYIQANRGVISVPELMSLTGLPPDMAEERITAYCAEFGGLPEATEDGTVVYRFDSLLLRADTQNRSFPGLSGPIKRLKSFSANKKKMNVWFSLINGVNLVFGSYFLYNALNTGAILTQADFNASSYLYGVLYVLLSSIIVNPLPFIVFVLGVIPLIFSLLFWLIPGLRFVQNKRNNEDITLENFRKSGYSRIWDLPLAVKPQEIIPQAKECQPRNLAAAQDRIIKEFGAYANPDVSLDETGKPVYSFGELNREKAALVKYRAGISPGASDLGRIVFDSGTE